MDADTALKILLYVSISFALIAIAVGIYRLLYQLSQLIKDSRETVKNINELTTSAKDDYFSARSSIMNVRNMGNFANILGLGSKIFGKFRSKEE